MTTLLYERRLIGRVHAVWQRRAAGGLPKASQFRPEDFGTDWWNCFLIDLAHEPKHFSYIGVALQNSALPLSLAELTEYCRGTLLEIIARQVPRAVEKKAPLGFGGSVLLNDGEFLYRAILLPLSENGERVDGMFGALASREIVVTNSAPVSDIAWGDRENAERAPTVSRRGARSDVSDG